MNPDIIIRSSAFVFTLFSGNVIADGEAISHCASAEQVIYSCQLGDSGQLVSICTSMDFAADAGYLQFRLGPPGVVEFEFPESRENTQSQFMYNHYFRAQYDLADFTFRTGDNKYVIYDYYNGEEEGESSTTGLRINDVDEDCAGPVNNHLGNLEGILPCDRENSDVGNCE